MCFLYITTRTKKAQREPHLYNADHAVILGQANTLRATAEHHKMSSIKQGVCEGEVELLLMPNAMIFDIARKENY